MGQALYRKYRSKTFAEVIGQEHITQTLENALKNQRISHAYLFTGPKGVGKTSVARILAHEVNRLPYDDDTMHLDIIEIDAASNRRIDEIRDLREKSRLAPAAAKYKVYIIDEVHMLTKEAFNALLKTLEEPPPHCIFILATTESHKLPETIISRTQKFQFRPIAGATAAGHLKTIAEKEGIEITDSALELLSRHGNGSFRDSISVLDQLSSPGKAINDEDVREVLGLPPSGLITQTLEAIQSNNRQDLLDAVREIRLNGLDAVTTAKDILSRLRAQIESGQANEAAVRLAREMLEVGSSADPEVYLELCLLESITGTEPSPTIAAEPLPKAAAKEIATINAVKTPAKKPSEQKSTTSASLQMDLARWPDILKIIKNTDAGAYRILRLATPRLEDGNLVLAFEFPLHQKKASQAAIKDSLGRAIDTLTGSKITIESVVEKNTTTPEKPANTKPNALATPQLDAISNIFGSVEMLES